MQFLSRRVGDPRMVPKRDPKPRTPNQGTRNPWTTNLGTLNQWTPNTKPRDPKPEIPNFPKMTLAQKVIASLCNFIKNMQFLSRHGGGPGWDQNGHQTRDPKVGGRVTRAPPVRAGWLSNWLAGWLAGWPSRPRSPSERTSLGG